MHGEAGEARVVSSVVVDGSTSTLVEDTLTTDSEASQTENHRTWSTDAGSEVTTISFAARGDAGALLAEQVTEALVGAVLVASMVSGVGQEAVAPRLRDAREAPLRPDEDSLVVDGHPAHAVVVSSGGVTLRGCVVDETVVVVVGDRGPLSLTLTRG